MLFYYLAMGYFQPFVNFGLQFSFAHMFCSIWFHICDSVTSISSHWFLFLATNIAGVWTLLYTSISGSRLKDAVVFPAPFGPAIIYKFGFATRFTLFAGAKLLLFFYICKRTRDFLQIFYFLQGECLKIRKCMLFVSAKGISFPPEFLENHSPACLPFLSRYSLHNHPWITHESPMNHPWITHESPMYHPTFRNKKPSARYRRWAWDGNLL